MNTKMNKGLIGITLAFIMIASVFAAIAPSTTADVKATAQFDTAKETMNAANTTVDTTMTYKVGDTAIYRITYTNTDPNLNCTLNLYDILPDGSRHDFGNGIFFLKNGTQKVYYYSYTIKPGDVRAADVDGYPYDHIANYAHTNGTNENEEPITDFRGKFSRILYDLPPSFDFNWTAIGCLEVEFDPTYTAENTTIVNHTWDFGDGPTVGPIAGPPVPITHNYSSCKAKTVTLSGCAANGLCASTTDVIYVDCGPTAIAKASSSCFEAGGSEITFNGSESHADLNNLVYPQEIASWHWTFDDPSLAESWDNVTTRTITIETVATLTVVDTLGCEHTATVRIIPCSECQIRIYGTFGEGAGDDSIKCENWPYTDPQGPFYPQSLQAPRKDFIQFNPAIMEHNDGYPDIYFKECDNVSEVQHGVEKVFKRMWYEKLLFKDHSSKKYKDYCYTVVVEKYDKKTYTWKYDCTMCLDAWRAIPEWQKTDRRLREWNNDEKINDSNVDIYGPAIVQEFTYMFTDEEIMPLMVANGSRVYIPMAHQATNSYSGLNSFDALPTDGVTKDYVFVESEESLGFDIDGDGKVEPMGDFNELDGDETVVLVLPQKTLKNGDVLQFFDHKVELVSVSGPENTRATLRVSDNEGGDAFWTDVSLGDGDRAFFHRGIRDETLGGLPNPGCTFFVEYITANWDGDEEYVIVRVGRMFGETQANIGVSQYWNQKAFMVDGVLYEVVAIKAEDNCIKFITFRQKLPKYPIKLYGKHLRVWEAGMTLPEMPPYNMQHDILEDVQTTWTIPTSMQAKIGPEIEDMPPLAIDYVEEDIEWRYKGELKEIYNESYGVAGMSGLHEWWELEWFHTYPWQYTSFRLPDNDTYLVVLSWRANEAETTIWDGGDETEPIEIKQGDRFKFWYRDCTGPLYIFDETSSIRLYGTFDQGAGDSSAIDEYTNLTPENWPYTEPQGPFFPQHEQTPEKDFLTFNPAIMEHNDGYSGLVFYDCGDYPEVQHGNEKVFKRMWYEKLLFKDHSSKEYGDNCYTVVVEKWNSDVKQYKYDSTICLDDWAKIPDWIKFKDKLRIREWNNDEDLNDSNVDIYGPALVQEFTYMFTDEETMPKKIRDGSRVLIPMAHQDADPYSGLNSFDALLNDGIDMDYLRVESENSLGFDIDGDGLPLERMDNGGGPLSGDETVVLVLDQKELKAGETNEIRFFDHMVRLQGVSGPTGVLGTFRIYSMESKDPVDPNAYTEVSLGVGQRAFFHRGQNRDSAGVGEFFIEVVALDWNTQTSQRTARVRVGRMFGETWANIGSNPYWNQKAFIVDGVLYEVVAIRAYDDCIKFITFRQKVPKAPYDIKLYGVHLRTFAEGELLPEMPPFNMEHDILKDVQNTWTRPYSQQDKIGPKEDARPPLEIRWVDEDVEERFRGELKEIYNESAIPDEGLEEEWWELEWFHTYPEQYTNIQLPEGELYLMTTAWYAPEAETTIWDHNPDGPIKVKTDGDRVKFWYDPADNRDIYINKMGEGLDPGPSWGNNITLYYDAATNGGNGNGLIEDSEVINAVMNYLLKEEPFEPLGPFDVDDLINYILDYLTTHP